jgi:hypothetical protein
VFNRRGYILFLILEFIGMEIEHIHASRQHHMTTDCLLGTPGIVPSACAGTSIILVLILLARYQGLGQALVKAVPAADSGLRSVCPFSNHYRLDNEADTHRLNMSSQAESSLPAARLLLMLEVLDASLDAQRGKQFAPNRGIPSTLATARYTYKGTCFCVDHVQSATLAALAVS